jgi:hypothetical protein
LVQSELRNNARRPRPDFVAISCHWTPQPTGLFDRRRFAAMEKESVLVNFARGEIFDAEALAEALEQGHLRGATLDVQVDEFKHPPPARLTEHADHAACLGRQRRGPAPRRRIVSRQSARLGSALFDWTRTSKCCIATERPKLLLRCFCNHMPPIVMARSGAAKQRAGRHNLTKLATECIFVA